MVFFKEPRVIDAELLYSMYLDVFFVLLNLFVCQ